MPADVVGFHWAAFAQNLNANVWVVAQDHIEATLPEYGRELVVPAKGLHHFFRARPATETSNRTPWSRPRPLPGLRE